MQPQKIHLRTDHLHTLNDFQRLLGDIQWIRPYLKLPNSQLQPLYDILPGDTDLNSPRKLTPEGKEALKLVEDGILEASLARKDESQPFLLCILQTIKQSTGVVWQGAQLLWVHPRVFPAETLLYYPDAVAQLALLGLQQCLQFFGSYPQSVIVPYTAAQVEVLSALWMIGLF